ncbi:uncharacterized protein K452DRAFT_295925 [Aplosporella prunicola CBS 121167]|uniref:Autophagy-related protein n=1 Tax=Aplosporella prunicola CBS 121167 TaxID=1176127 RepID=A0A6A6BMG4_9PEZI|nr:uncharacterized protein K452DRAFT_295925 [Aplosporella prunicola CBS 121167]KAF2144484.1 hypothetical protein K452DRAFT_295925 [Aplosporella prunicola CBS 121167]
MVPRHPEPTSEPPPPRPRFPRQSSTFSKRSFASSYGHEADDERSPIMGPDADYGPVRPRYPDEDTSLTSRRELSGFYIYGWAAEVFVVCGVGKCLALLSPPSSSVARFGSDYGAVQRSFIPITLEQLARERGVLLSDRKTPCTSLIDIPDPPTAASPPSDSVQCVVNVLGVEINTASFAMYTFSISVLIQALLIISMSGAADHGRYRKTLLLIFAFVGSTATMLFLPIVPKVYVLGALLAIVANTCFGASFVLLNSFLPLLVRHHPSAQQAYIDPDEDPYFEEDETRLAEEEPVEEDEPVLEEIDRVDSRTALIRASGTDITEPLPRSSAATSEALTLSTKISSYGIGIGYIAALLVQTFSIFLVIAIKSTTFSLRLVLFCIGAWWFIFAIPAAFWLKSRPGPPLRIDTSGGKARTCFAYFSYSWKSLGKTVMHARRLKDILLFLGAWFLLSDAIATVSGTAVLFAKTSLEMKPAAIALINVIATISGIVGAFSWSRLSILMGLRPSQTILCCIGLFEIIPIYGLLGYIPAIRRLGVFGLQQPWEMYPLGAVYGFVLGGLSSYCRSLFGELIPPGFEAAFYALYAITDKGSSVFGPAVVGAITDATGEIRPAFWFLAALIGLPFPLMLAVNVERGKYDALALSEDLNGSEDGACNEQGDGDDLFRWSRTEDQARPGDGSR